MTIQIQHLALLAAPKYTFGLTTDHFQIDALLTNLGKVATVTFCFVKLLFENAQQTTDAIIQPHVKYKLKNCVIVQSLCTQLLGKIPVKFR